jgi:hypothetical protein
MPLANYSEACSEDSSSDRLSACSDFESSESASPILSDQTLLRQAFKGAVRGRKVVAREWRTERECDISHTAGLAVADEAASESKKSYLRSLMRKLRLTRK